MCDLGDSDTERRRGSKASVPSGMLAAWGAMSGIDDQGAFIMAAVDPEKKLTAMVALDDWRRANDERRF